MTGKRKTAIARAIVKPVPETLPLTGFHLEPSCPEIARMKMSEALGAFR